MNKRAVGTRPGDTKFRLTSGDLYFSWHYVLTVYDDGTTSESGKYWVVTGMYRKAMPWETGYDDRVTDANGSIVRLKRVEEER